ncbi:MAG: PhzF family phenazine biosynthesis protein [Deltaproteobacteria bacterium]|nr:PhzF family phenazine biosynthesis protein [Deltaproteobacteria bacterium]
MLKTFAFRLVDVFTSVPFGGNPLAVFLDARGLPERQEGERQRVVFENDAGAISVTLIAPMLTMQQPRPTLGAVLQDRDAVAAMLGLDATALVPELPVQAASCGVPYLLVPVVSREALARIRFRLDIWERVLRRSPHPQVYAFTLDSSEGGAHARCRMFAPGMGVQEDPATATAAGPLAAYFVDQGLLPTPGPLELKFEQGIEMGRPSSLHVLGEQNGQEILSLRVGGQCVAVGQGIIQAEV